MPKAVDTIGQSNVTVITPTIIAKELLRVLPSKLKLANIVAKDTDLTPEKQGKTITVAIPADPTVKTKTEGNAYELQTSSLGNVDITLDTHAYVSFLIEDIVEVTKDNKINLKQEKLVASARVLAESIETKLGLLVKNFAKKLGSAGVDITKANILSARAHLVDNRAPEEDLHLVTVATQTNALLGIEQFTNMNYMNTPEAMRMGKITDILGFKHHESIFLEKVAGSPITTHNVALHRDAMVLATRPFPVYQAPGVSMEMISYEGLTFRIVSGYDQSYGGMRVTVETLFGVGILRSDLAIDMIS